MIIHTRLVGKSGRNVIWIISHTDNPDDPVVVTVSGEMRRWDWSQFNGVLQGLMAEEFPRTGWTARRGTIEWNVK